MGLWVTPVGNIEWACKYLGNLFHGSSLAFVYEGARFSASRLYGKADEDGTDEDTDGMRIWMHESEMQPATFIGWRENWPVELIREACDRLLAGEVHLL